MDDMVKSMKQQYQTDEVHLLVPTAYISGLEGSNPFYKISVSRVQVDTDSDHHEIYWVGSNNKISFFALAKPALERFAAAAGISIISASSYTRMVDEYTMVGHVEAALLTPDGSPRLMTNEKVIDMRIEKKRIYAGQMESVKKGLTGKTAYSVKDLYKGEWRECKGKDDKTYNAFFITSETDQKAYAKAATDLAMLQLWKDVPQKAWTGAWLRVIRSALNMRPTYTLAELKKPFFITRLDFRPDYSNPDVRQMALEQGFRSMGILYAAHAPSLQMPSSSYSEVPAGNPPAAPKAEPPQNTPQSEPDSDKPNSLSAVCADCKKEIHGPVERMQRYMEKTQKTFGKFLCPDCAKKAAVAEQAKKAAEQPVAHVCADCGHEIKFRDKDEKFVDDYCRRSVKATGRVLCPVCAEKSAAGKNTADAKASGQARQKPALGPYELTCQACGTVFDMEPYAKKYNMTRAQIEEVLKRNYGGIYCQDCISLGVTGAKKGKSA